MDTLLILKDTIAVSLVNANGLCKKCIQEVPTNCNDAQIVALICGSIVAVVLITAFSLLVYYIVKNIQLCKQRKAERNREKEEKLFSLRKEYQKVILSILEPKETPRQKQETSEKSKTESEKLNGGSEGKDNKPTSPNDIAFEAKKGEYKESSDDSKLEIYIKELRECIEWIDSQKK